MEQSAWLDKIVTPPFMSYISYFSMKSDDLRQWIPYGDDGRGVAIGFKGMSNRKQYITDGGA
jgi:hypothetical protein